jgi:hypothetical protein
MERVRSIGPMLITAPSEDERQYEMAVRIAPSEYQSAKFERRPWLKIRAELSTGEIYLSAGVKVKRVPEEEDGA